MSKKEQMLFNQKKISLTKGLKPAMDQLFDLAKKAYLKKMIPEIAKIKINYLMADRLIWFYVDPYFKSDQSKLGMVQVQTSKPAKDLIGICLNINGKYPQAEHDALIRLKRNYENNTQNIQIASALANYTARLKRLLFRIRYSKLMAEHKLGDAIQDNREFFEVLKHRVSHSNIWTIVSPKMLKDKGKQKIKLEAYNMPDTDLELLSNNTDQPFAFGEVTVEQGKLIDYNVKANINDPKINKLKRNKIEAVDLALSLDHLDWLKIKVLDAEKELQNLLKVNSDYNK